MYLVWLQIFWNCSVFRFLFFWPELVLCFLSLLLYSLDLRFRSWPICNGPVEKLKYMTMRNWLIYRCCFNKHFMGMGFGSRKCGDFLHHTTFRRQNVIWSSFSVGKDLFCSPDPKLARVNGKPNLVYGDLLPWQKITGPFLF